MAVKSYKLLRLGVQSVLFEMRQFAGLKKVKALVGSFFEKRLLKRCLDSQRREPLLRPDAFIDIEKNFKGRADTLVNYLIESTIFCEDNSLLLVFVTDILTKVLSGKSIHVEKYGFCFSKLSIP